MCSGEPADLKCDKKISTHLLTVLTTCVIVHIEHERRAMFLTLPVLGSRHISPVTNVAVDTQHRIKKRRDDLC